MGRKWDDTLIFFKSKTILLFVIPALPCLFLSWSIKSKSFALVRWSTGSVAESVTTILDIPFQIAKLSIIKYRKLCWGRQKWDDVFNGDLFQLRNTEI